MAKYQAEFGFIGSIYPGVLQPIRRHYGPSPEGFGRGAVRSTLFELTPVARERMRANAFVLKVEDSFESVINVIGERGSRLNKPVPWQEIIQDLLAHWTGNLFNVPAGCAPGVMQIANSRPSENELDQMVAQQTRYFEYLFAEGERLSGENQWKEITDTMRLAAKWLNHPRAWSHEALARDSEPCPICTKVIPRAAFKCPFCQSMLKALPKDLADLQVVGTK